MSAGDALHAELCSARAAESAAREASRAHFARAIENARCLRSIVDAFCSDAAESHKALRATLEGAVGEAGEDAGALKALSSALADAASTSAAAARAALESGLEDAGAHSNVAAKEAIKLGGALTTAAREAAERGAAGAVEAHAAFAEGERQLDSSTDSAREALRVAVAALESALEKHGTELSARAELDQASTATLEQRAREHSEALKDASVALRAQQHEVHRASIVQLRDLVASAEASQARGLEAQQCALAEAEEARRQGEREVAVAEAGAAAVKTLTQGGAEQLEMLAALVAAAADAGAHLEAGGVVEHKAQSAALEHARTALGEDAQAVAAAAVAQAKKLRAAAAALEKGNAAAAQAAALAASSAATKVGGEMAQGALEQQRAALVAAHAAHAEKETVLARQHAATLEAARVERAVHCDAQRARLQHQQEAAAAATKAMAAERSALISDVMEGVRSLLEQRVEEMHARFAGAMVPINERTNELSAANDNASEALAAHEHRA